MEIEKSRGELFHVEVREGIYLLSTDAFGPTADTKSLAPGNPTTNSYLVLGPQRALLFDLAVDDPRLFEYAKALAGKPVQLVLSHGHYDHAYHLNLQSEAWVHPADNSLLQDGMPIAGLPPVSPCPPLHPLHGGGTIDLGGRVLDVIHIPGHTDGSIVLLDRQTKTLLGGDTAARRLLYGLSTFVPFDAFCASLRRLQQADFEVIYAAHDRCALPKSHLEWMIRRIENDLPHGTVRRRLEPLPEMAVLPGGEQALLSYFDVAVPARYL